MIAQTSFFTKNRQDYIDIGIHAAHSLSLHLPSKTSLCIGVQGPCASGKSLFFDAIIHQLTDHLDTQSIPPRPHMILEKRPDEAYRKQLSQVFKVSAMDTRIGFANHPTLKHDDLAHLTTATQTVDISLFSFQDFDSPLTMKDLFNALPIIGLYQIKPHGKGLDRQWRSWHAKPHGLQHTRN